MDMSLGGPQNRFGRREEEKILDPTGLELRPLGRPARSSKSLYRLSYPGFYFEHCNEEENPKARSWNCRIV
jgi:hypothetical protein